MNGKSKSWMVISSISYHTNWNAWHHFMQLNMWYFVMIATKYDTCNNLWISPSPTLVKYLFSFTKAWCLPKLQQETQQPFDIKFSHCNMIKLWNTDTLLWMIHCHFYHPCVWHDSIHLLHGMRIHHCICVQKHYMKKAYCEVTFCALMKHWNCA